MIDGFGLGGQAIDERDRLGEIVERDLVTTYVAESANSVGELVSNGGSFKILDREPALAVRGVCERYPLVVDQDVWVMIDGFGLRRKAIDERDRLRKVREGVLFVDRVAVEDPAVEALDTLLDFRS